MQGDIMKIDSKKKGVGGGDGGGVSRVMGEQ